MRPILRRVYPSIARSLTMLHPNGARNGASPYSTYSSQYSLTSLRRWSCGDNTELPPKETISSIHVYDFDNTLFATPLPNKQLWESRTQGKLMEQEAFANGGWWHDSSILAATGQGVEKEEPRAWDGWWNEQVVELVRLSMEQKEALNVLLTGRNETNYAALIKRILASKKLSFDLICLKPAVSPSTSQKFSSTMNFKQALLSDIVLTYTAASEIRIYEDRPKHIRGFRDFFTQLNATTLSPNASSLRGPIDADVVHVAENVVCLDPTTEVAAIQRMINIHNLAVKEGTAPSRAVPYRINRNVFFTAYLLPDQATKQLSSLVTSAPYSQPESSDIRFLANSIMIFPRPSPAPQSLLTRVGGIGHSVSWRVTATTCLDNRLWAAKVVPTNSNETIFTDPNPALVVLALRRGTRPSEANRIRNWQPVAEDKAFVFDATVGEKAILRIDEEFGSGHQRPPPAHGGGGVLLDADGHQAKKVNMRQQDFIPLGGLDDGNKSSGYGYGYGNDENRRPQQHGAISGNRGPSGQYNRGGRGGKPYDRQPRNDRPGGAARGGGYRGGGSQRGRGRGGAYRSLDDVGGGGYQDHDGGYRQGDGGLRYDY